jgi:HEAT repeat protein
VARASGYTGPDVVVASGERPIRSLLVDLLKNIQGKEATEALALRALFDLSPQVRKSAVEALADRPAEEYQPILLQGFRYPWPAAAIHAANALMELGIKEKSLVPGLVELLKEPNPRLPFTVEVEKKPGEVQKVLAVRAN